MKLYCTPGGKWAGTEAAWKAAVKAEGLDHKTIDRRQVEVPTAKAELLEFLTFHHVNPIGGNVSAQVIAGGGNPPPPTPSAVALVAPTVPQEGALDLDQLFDEAPIGAQLRLAMFAINKAKAQLAP